MRCFIALPLPEGAASALAAAASALREGWPRLSWARPEAYHLTLAFLGEIEEPALSCARRSIAAARASAKFAFRFSGLDGFRAGQRPGRGDESSPLRVIFARLDDGGAGLEIHELVNEALAREARIAGLPPLNPEWPAGRPFAPHVTLARVPERGGGGQPPRKPPCAADLALLAPRLDALMAGEWTIGCCALYKSDLRPRGALYTVLGKEGLRAASDEPADRTGDPSAFNRENPLRA
jgi:2'-5' RNA ligase